MNITSAQYMRTEDAPTVDDHIKAVIDGETFLVPINTGNVDYVAIKRKHDDPDDSFTIADAD